MSQNEIFVLLTAGLGALFAVWAVVSFIRDGHRIGRKSREQDRTREKELRPETEEQVREAARKMRSDAEEIVETNRWLLSAPEFEQRSSPRDEFNGITPVIVLGNSTSGAGVLLDISEDGGGLSISSNFEFAAGERVKVRFEDRETVSCEVVYSRKIKAGWRLGLQIQPGDPGRERIQDLVDSLV